MFPLQPLHHVQEQWTRQATACRQRGSKWALGNPVLPESNVWLLLERSNLAISYNKIYFKLNHFYGVTAAFPSHKKRGSQCKWHIANKKQIYNQLTNPSQFGLKAMARPVGIKEGGQKLGPIYFSTCHEFNYQPFFWWGIGTDRLLIVIDWSCGKEIAEAYASQDARRDCQSSWGTSSPCWWGYAWQWQCMA